MGEMGDLVATGERRGVGVVVTGGVWMKANKKNKRKQGKQQGGVDDPGQSLPAPQRVQTNSPFSVRTQIKYAKMRKQAEKRQAFPASSTKTYRRVRPTDYDTDIVEPEDLSKVYMPDIAPSLMVDGYNILHYWSKTIFVLEKNGLEEARIALLDELDALAAMRGWAVTVVFDAHKRKGESRRGYTTANQIKVVYTGEGESADMYVERQTMELKDAGCPSVMVATGDKLMQALVTNAGAEVFSPDRIIEEIEISREEASVFADRYVRRKEQLTAKSDLKDIRDSVQYVGKARGKGRGGRGQQRGNSGRGGRGERSFSIEDDFDL